VCASDSFFNPISNAC
jgi:hypothetical protein